MRTLETIARHARSLPAKIGGIVFVLFGAYAIAQSHVQKTILYPSFVALEEAEATENYAIALKAIGRDLESLGRLATEWATSNNTSEFLQRPDRAMVDLNLSRDTLRNLQVNYLGFVNSTGEVIWHQAMSPESGESLLPADLGFSFFDEADRLFEAMNPGFKGCVGGLRASPSGPVLVTAAPVPNIAGNGRARGVVIMARLLNESEVARLAVQAQLNLKLEPVGRRRSAERPTNRTGGIAHTTPTLGAASSTTFMSTTMFDLDGKPIIRLRVDTPRNITRQGQKALHYAHTALAVVGFVMLASLLLMLDRAVFRPINELTNHAMKMGTTDDMESRLNLHRGDEIGMLGQEFDRMVGRLADARARTLDQSYKSGIAEMASGVLHNIGNATTPLGINLSGMLTNLKRAPLNEVAQASAELTDPVTPDKRRVDLEQFMVLVAADLAGLTKKAIATVHNALAHVEHIQQILVDQQRFARAERVTESIKLSQIFREGIRLLPTDLQETTTIEVSPTLELSPEVRSSRAALSQIVTNLLLNAAEAIVEHRTRGHLWISSTVVEHDGTVALRTEILDDGVGINPDQLPRIFEAGVSTKNRGSGMGLHWCANTIAAMGGALWAESDGFGKGARMVMILPLADVAAGVKAEAA